MNGILAGLRIVEGSAFVAAPSAGMTLAQMGADVIRFDLPGGGIDHRRWPVTADGTSIYWAGLNKAKRSLVVDFRKPEGQELLTALIAQDGPDRGILSTNFPMRGWLAYDRLKEQRPDLIALNILGNPDGSVAVDYTVNAATGFPAVTGNATAERPVNHVLPAWDIATGYAAAAGILAAERRRSRTGEGQYVALALADVALAAVGNLGYVGEVLLNGTERPNIGNDVYGSYGRDFATADGRRIMLIAVSTAQWAKLVEATGTAEAMARIEAETGLDLAREEDRYAARDAIGAAFAPWCAERTLAETRTVLDAHNVCWGPYQTFAQMVAEDPRSAPGGADALYAEIDQPGLGRYRVPGTPHAFAGFERGHAPAPLLGQHTDEILSGELGLPDHEIARLHDTGIVAGPEGR